MRLSECKENMFSFAEREHSRSYHAAKIQNIFKMVVTLQPFLIQFSRFLSEYHKKHIKTTFYLNVMETIKLLEYAKFGLPSKKERWKARRNWARRSLVYPHIIYP